MSTNRAPLPDEAAVYRAMRPGWVDAVSGLKPVAYYVQRPLDDEGLSVSQCLHSARCSITCKAVYSLLTQHVRHVDKRLNVVTDPLPPNEELGKPEDPNHALLQGLPRYYSDDDTERLEAERLARRLVGISNLAWAK